MKILESYRFGQLWTYFLVTAFLANDLWSVFKANHSFVVGCHQPWAVVRLFNNRCTLPNNGTKCFTSSLPIWFIHGKWIFNLIIVHFHGSNAHFILNLRCVEWKCQSHSQYSTNSTLWLYLYTNTTQTD